jgi:hypothetical protein
MSAVQHRNMSALHWRPLKPTEDAGHIVTVGWEAIVCSAMAPNGTYPIHTGRLATTRFRSPFPKVAAVIDPQTEGEALALSTLSSTGIQKRQKSLVNQ